MSWGKYQNRCQMPHDLRSLAGTRKMMRDRRRRHTAMDRFRQMYLLKKEQFDLALHSRGLVSPYDYEYPRMKQMSQLARELHARHLRPYEELSSLIDLVEEVMAAVKHPEYAGPLYIG
jgi:hypothetical protein